MKLIVIVPLLITVEVPAEEVEDLYDSENALRREDFLRLALASVQTSADVELPDADNEGVIFLDENEEELPNELDDTQPPSPFRG